MSIVKKIVQEMGAKLIRWRPSIEDGTQSDDSLAKTVDSLTARAQAALKDEIEMIDKRFEEILAELSILPKTIQAELAFCIGQLCFAEAHEFNDVDGTIKRSNCTKRLAYAINFFKISLNLTDEQKNKSTWAMVITQLGHAISMQGATSPEPLKFDAHAAKCFETAMRLFANPVSDGAWLYAAKGFWSLHLFAAKGTAILNEKRRHLNAARSAIKSALDRLNFDQDDALRASVIRDLGYVEIQSGALGADVIKLQQGICHLLLAHKSLTSEGRVTSRILALEWLEEGVERLCKISAHSAVLEQVSAFYEQLTSDPFAIETAYEYGRTQLQFGKIFDRISDVSKNTQMMEAARHAFSEAMASIPKEEASYFWQQARWMECLCGIKILLSSKGFYASTMEENIQKLDDIIGDIIGDSPDMLDANLKENAMGLRAALHRIVSQPEQNAAKNAMRPS